MKILLTLSLVALGPLGAQANAHSTWGPPRALLAQVSEDDYDALVADYEVAYDDWRDALREAQDLTARRALRDAHPAKQFYPRFAALFDGGQGRALLWMVDNVADVHEKRSQAKAAKVALFSRLVEDHHSAPFAGEIIQLLKKQKTWLGEDGVRAFLEKLGDTSEDPEVAARALFTLAQRLSARGSDEERARSMALWDRITRDYPDTETAQDVAFSRTAHLYQEGGEPPSFETLDADDVTFKLSDYRGKVVLIDFWGFW